MSDVTVAGNATVGVYASAEAIRMRNTSVQQNGGDGVELAGKITSADLGNSLEPGNNIFLNNALSGAGPTSANLDLACTNACRVLASGNQWNAGVQGADSSGRYAAGSGSLEATSGAGRNYNVTAGTLVLAE